MLHVGIDEAGYGPLLGPLVVGAVALRVSEQARDGDAGLRRRLGGLVAKRSAQAAPGALPVPIDDSKAIHRRFGREGLLRGVDAFVAAGGAPPLTGPGDLLRRHCGRGAESYAEIPWYARLGDDVLPPRPQPEDLAARFRRRGVEAADLRLLPLDAGELNHRFESAGNKATVLGQATADLLLAVLDRHPDEEVKVILDRHGGRLHYAAWLEGLFPFRSVTRLAAPRGEARYEVRLPGRRLSVRVATRADGRCLTVAWASMAAKLTRELFMDQLNAWFRERRPGVRPTAGYVADGRRFLAEMDGVLREERIERRALVRER
jgi:hypothetical protein